MDKIHMHCEGNTLESAELNMLLSLRSEGIGSECVASMNEMREDIEDCLRISGREREVGIGYSMDSRGMGARRGVLAEVAFAGEYRGVAI